MLFQSFNFQLLSIQYSIRSQLATAVKWAKTTLFWLLLLLLLLFFFKKKLKKKRRKLLLKKKHSFFFPIFSLVRTLSLSHSLSLCLTVSWCKASLVAAASTSPSLSSSLTPPKSEKPKVSYPLLHPQNHKPLNQMPLLSPPSKRWHLRTRRRTRHRRLCCIQRRRIRRPISPKRHWRRTLNSQTKQKTQ